MDRPAVEDLFRSLEASVRSEQRAKIHEQRAKAHARRARDRVARLVRGLQVSGVKSSRIAHRVVMALGLPTTLEARRRLARSLRQRALRFATACRRNVEGVHGTASAAAIRSDAIEKEAAMPKQEQPERKLVKRVTEIFEQEVDEAAGLAGEDEADEDEESDDDHADEAKDRPPTSRRRRSRRY